jgi:hypothetical protein
LGNYLFEFGACALDFGKDGFGGCCPDVGFGTATKADVLAMERKLIVETGANNPAIGYNLTPR